jgi:ribosome-associated protein
MGGQRLVIDNSEAVACTCAHLADERKADDIVVMEVGPLAFFTEYFVIATGRNERQLRAIAEQVLHEMRALGHAVIGIEGEADSGWVLIDLGDVVVHLFSPEARNMYDLELLWGEAPRTEWRGVEPLTGVTQAEGQ